eukprot:857072-Pyramimonas_sp.AAC.1
MSSSSPSGSASGSSTIIPFEHIFFKGRFQAPMAVCRGINRQELARTSAAPSDFRSTRSTFKLAHALAGNKPSQARASSA